MYVVNDVLVREQIRNLPKFIRKQVVDAFIELQRDPYHACGAKLMTGGYSGYYRCVVGDYRIIYDIQEKQVTVLVMKVSRRDKVYED